MVDITIEQSTFKRLQRHTIPLVDSADTVINRALDAFEQLKGAAAPNEAPHPESEQLIDPCHLPDLKYTKVLDASIGGDQIAKPNWNLLLREILTLAMNKLKDLRQVRKICSVNMAHGRKEDAGHKYIPAIDISVQGKDANSACRAVVKVVKGLDVALEIGWKRKDGAAFRLKLEGSTKFGLLNEPLWKRRFLN